MSRRGRAVSTDESTTQTSHSGHPVDGVAGGPAAVRRAGGRRGWALAAPQRLLRSQLGVVDIAASTMANIAPAMSFYFGFGFLALTAGVASPLTILLAAVAVAFLGSTLAEFSRAHPSTGSFITFIGKAFGPASAVATSILLIAGYIVGIVAVIAMAGGFTALFLNHYISEVPLDSWPVFAIAFVALGAFLMVRGVHLSTRWAGVFFAFEMIVLVVVSVTALARHQGHLTLHPFEPHYLASGMRGLGLGFPLAVYMFIGWENSATLAEETDRPRRNVPLAIFASIAVIAGGYLLFTYATVEGFGENIAALSAAPIAFVTLADGALGTLAFFAYLAGVTSTVACVIAAVNSQSRLLFSAGREGLLPAWLGRVYARRGTPMNALLTFIGLGLALVFAWTAWQHVDPVSLFAEASTLGTMMIIVVYFLANLALPVYYERFRPAEFSVVRHLVLPLIGAVAIALPIYELFKPGIAPPYELFPYITAGVIGGALIYALWLNARDSTLAERVGSLVADERADGKPTEGKFALSFEEDGGESLLQRLVRVSAALDGERDLRRALREVLPLLGDTLAMDAVAVFQGGGEGSARLLAVHGRQAPRDCPPLALDAPGSEGLLGGGLVDLSAAAEVPEALRAAACRDCWTLLVVGSAHAGERGILLELSRRRPVKLTPQEAEFAVAATQAIDLAARSRALAQEVERSAAVLQTAYAVAKAITQSLDLGETYREIAAAAARVVAGSRCVLFEAERESGVLVAVAASGADESQLLGSRVRLLPDGTGEPAGGVLPGSAVQELAPAGAAGGPPASKFRLGARAEGALAGTFGSSCSLVVPLVAQGELVGCLLVDNARRRRGYSPSEVAELRAVGEQAAISINNARLFRALEASQTRVEVLLERLVRTRDEERRALARVVHDDIVQSIVGAVYRLESLGEELPADSAQDFSDAVAVLRQSAVEARRVIWELRPPAIEGLGLTQALRTLAERAQARCDAQVSLDLAEVPDMPTGVTTGLYRIAREALLNSARHAGASHIELSLAPAASPKGRAVRLRVADDGVGVGAAAAAGDDDHYGRTMMAEQATLMGGTLTVGSAPGLGTSVDVVVPLYAEGARDG